MATCHARRRRARGCALRGWTGRLLLGLALTAAAAGVAGAEGTTTRVSVGPGGTEVEGRSYLPSISADGRFIVFVSEATLLVPGHSNRSRSDVFMHNRATGVTSLVTIGSDGADADGPSYNPAISADGRFVAFASGATNLVPDGAKIGGLLVRDRLTGVTSRVSLGPGGVLADQGGDNAAISADGRFVAFLSYATNLVPGDTNGVLDVFVRDRRAGVTTRVSVGPGGVQGDRDSLEPAISADGRVVAFRSAATNLVAGDTNDAIDFFAHDRRTGVTSRVGLGTAVQPAGGSHLEVSANGRLVAFASANPDVLPGGADERVDVFVHNRRTGRTKRVSAGPAGAQANCVSLEPAISASRRFVAFTSCATNLVPGGAIGFFDVFVRDRIMGATSLVSGGMGGTPADGNSSSRVSISADGRFVAFSSFASNLVPGDTNGVQDVFVHDRGY